MALTTIDATPALVVIDLQKGIVALPTAHPVDDVVRNSPRRGETATTAEFLAGLEDA